MLSIIMMSVMFYWDAECHIFIVILGVIMPSVMVFCSFKIDQVVHETGALLNPFYQKVKGPN